jgi:hypothetical protein
VGICFILSVRNNDLRIIPTMKKSSNTPISANSLKELEDLVMPEIQRVKAEQLQAGLYNLYRYNGVDGSKNLFVRKYANHSELVKVDVTTGESHIINSNL